jgi:hypothetical protein
MFNIINEQDLIIAFLDAGCEWTEARMLAMEAKLELMFNDQLTIEEVVSNLLSKKSQQAA